MPPSGPPGGPRTVGRALAEAAAVSLAWHVVLVAAAYGLLPLTSSWSPDLSATAVTLVAALVPVAVVLRRGWTTRPWLRLRRPRRPLLLVPVLAVALSYGVPGIAGTPGSCCPAPHCSSRSASARSC